MKHALLSLLILCVPVKSFAETKGKVGLTGGYFSLNAKAGDNNTSVSSPSAFRASYHYPMIPHLEVVGGYSVLMADFSGTDMGYGLDLGANYYPFTSTADEKIKTQTFTVTRYDLYSPYVGLGFYQRQFQSVKNSYAGMGICAGSEMYYNQKINFKAEARVIQLAGSGNSTATETSLLVGIVYKL